MKNIPAEEMPCAWSLLAVMTSQYPGTKWAEWDEGERGRVRPDGLGSHTDSNV